VCARQERAPVLGQAPPLAEGEERAEDRGADVAPGEAKRLASRHEGSVALSAATGEGVDELLRTIGDRLRALTEVVEMVVPYDRGDLLAALHREGEVVSESHEADGIRVRARLAPAAKAKIATESS
jgi:GTP-binding protein HflX